jgi:PKD repeat protein
MLLSVLLVVAGLAALAPTAQAADTGKTAPQPGKIVSEEPGKNAPNILDGTVYSITQVGNTIVVGGQFSQVQNFNTSAIIPRNNVFAFDATTGRVSTTFNPSPNGTVFKVQAAMDGTSVYVGGRFSSAYGVSMPSRLFKADVASGARDATFRPGTISGDIRDLEVTGNRLWVAGKFTHINGVAQKALGTINATTGVRDSYFTGLFAGTHRDPTVYTADRTNVLQITTNPANNRLVAVGNFTSVNGTARSQIAQFDIGSASYSLTSWYTTLFTSSCSRNFETIMTDIEYSPNGSFFVASTTAAYGGATASNAGTSGCDVVARFESSSTSSASKASWTAYTGGDTTWTVEVTDNVVYAGGHQAWQNNPSGHQVAGQGAVAREGIAALNPANGMPYSWNPTRARGVGVQDMLATSEGLYVGSDTNLIGPTPGNQWHAKIAFLPLVGGKRLPAMSPHTLPGNIYVVPSGGTQLVRRAHTGSALTSSANAPNGPGWGSSVGAFMVNGVLYKANSDGLVWKQTFDGTNYGPMGAVNASDLLAPQTDWHTDVKTITSLFYAGGFIYYTKAGTNALYRRGFETESDVVGQQRFSTTTSGINWANAKGAFVASGKVFYTDANGKLWRATWNQTAHAPTASTSVQVGSSGWKTRAIFPYQGAPAPVNDAPTATITGASCAELACSFKGSTSTDWDGDPLTYSWDFGDASPTETTADAAHTYATSGPRTVTLTVNDGKGHTDTETVTVNPQANRAPTARITDASCTRLDCSFKGLTSSDPDGDPLTYSWDFGDTTGAVTTANASHTYGTPGAKTVTLTVKDVKGNTDTDTVTATATDPAASQVAYVGSASSAGSRVTHSVTLPSGVKEGDTMVLFFGAASIAPTYGAPAGWTLLRSENGSSYIAARAWTKTATAADAAGNAKVSFTSSATAKSDLTVAVYRGTDGTPPITSSAVKIDNLAGSAHTSPTVTATEETDWLVTYWVERSSDATGWLDLVGATQRLEGAPSDTGNAHVTGLLADSNGPVAAGTQGGLTATGNGNGSRGGSFSVLLKSS